MRELMRINAQRWPSVVVVTVNPIGELHSSQACPLPGIT